MLRLQLGLRRPTSTAVAVAASSNGRSGGSRACRICTAVISRSHQPQQPTAKRHLSTTKNARASRNEGRRGNLLPVGSPNAAPIFAKPLFRPPRGDVSAWSRANLSSTAASLCGERRHGQSLNPRQAGGSRSVSSSTSRSTDTAATTTTRVESSGGSVSVRDALSLPLAKVVAPVQQVTKVFLAQQDVIPTEESTLAALRTCEIAAGLLREAAVPLPKVTTLEPQSSTTASTLLSMDAGAAAASAPASAAATAPTSRGKGPRERRGVTATNESTSSPPSTHRAGGTASAPQGSSTAPRSSDPVPPRARLSTPPAAAATSQIDSSIDTISEASYDIISHPAVLITPQILERYVAVQSSLGRPETLPHVLSLFAAKPVPQAGAGGSGSISYTKPNPNRPSGAVEPSVVETALGVAIEAKNLDAAVAIIENTYATKAFARSKFIQKALLRVSIAAGLPALIYVLATGLARFQNTMDDSRATTIAFAGVATYLGFTAIIGAVAAGTGNDQMKRVTWTPGTSLTRRWFGEEERAALDRVACSFGFSEATRYGEEEGAEFQALREYILRKGMILDRVELMEGMS